LQGEFEMPFWAVIYCFLIVLSGIGVVVIYKRRPTYYIPGQVLSSLCGVLMFLFYYGSFVHKPQSFLVILVMFSYILYWELWENRHLFHTLVTEKKNSSEEGLVFFEETFTMTKKAFMSFLVTIFIVSLPFLYVVMQLMISYL